MFLLLILLFLAASNNNGSQLSNQHDWYLHKYTIENQNQIVLTKFCCFHSYCGSLCKNWPCILMGLVETSIIICKTFFNRQALFESQMQRTHATLLDAWGARVAAKMSLVIMPSCWSVVPFALLIQYGSSQYHLTNHHDTNDQRPQRCRSRICWSNNNNDRHSIQWISKH